MADFNNSPAVPALTAVTGVTATNSVSLTNKTINDDTNLVRANSIFTAAATTPVSVSGVPLTGQVITSLTSTTAGWSTPIVTSPAGSNGFLQYNNAGAFGGANLVYSGATVDGTVGALGIGAPPTAGVKLLVGGLLSVSGTGIYAMGVTINNTDATAGDAGRTFIVLAPQNAATQQEIVGIDGRLSLRSGGIPGSVFAVEGMALWSNRNVSIGSIASEPSSRLTVKGSGLTSSTFAGVFQNSAGSSLLVVRDNGFVDVGIANHAGGDNLSILSAGEGNGIRIINASGSVSFGGLRQASGGGHMFLRDGANVDKVDIRAVGDSFITSPLGIGGAPISGHKLNVYGFMQVKAAGGDASISVFNTTATAGDAGMARIVLVPQNNGAAQQWIVGVDGRISFRAGGDPPLEGMALWPSRNATIGDFSSDPGVRLAVKGSGTTSSTTALKAQDSAGVDIVTARNDGAVSLRNGVFVNEFSTDTTLGGNSDLAVPTEAAVKSYVDSRNVGTTVFTRDAIGASITRYPVGVGANAYKPVRSIRLTGLTVVGNSTLITGSLTVTVYKNSESSGNIVFEVTTTFSGTGAFRLTDFTVNNATMDAITASDTFFVKVATGAATAIDDLAGFIDHTID